MGGTSLAPLRSFGFPDQAAASPQAAVMEASNGKLYGTTAAGGHANKGTLFQVNKDGSGFYVLKSFGSETNDGQWPMSPVIEGTDGFLYGTTDEGGEFGRGTVYRSDKSGSSFSVLLSFDGTNGAYPEVRLLEGSDGRLYGTTSGGGPGTNDYGVVFRLNKNGSGFELLKAFAGHDGANPEGGLLEATDGVLYGVTLFGGGTNLAGWTTVISTNVGVVFRLAKDGSDFSVLKHFHRYPFDPNQSSVLTNGYYPYGELVQGTNGFLYGTTSAGGRGQAGTIYEINTNGAGFATLCELTNTTGAKPLDGLRLASDGLLYGTASEGGANGNGAVFRMDQEGGNYTTLLDLVSGQGPAATVLESDEGEMFGTTPLGGVSGDGTIFKIHKDGTGFAVLHNFSSAGGDGASAYAALTAGSDGRFFGATRLGSEQGAGAVFSIDPLGRGYRILASLSPTNAANPIASVTEGATGALFGTTVHGGPSNQGTLFKLDTDQNLARLHDFGGAGDGYFPSAALTEGTNGLLYGVTSSGDGGVFRMAPDGTGYTVLKSLGTTWLNPLQPLLQASDGWFYGTTYFSYSPSSATNGCIFRLDENGGSFAVLKYFVASTNGANPMSPLLEGSDGRLYGTTYSGGTTNSAGVVYRLNKDGTGFEVLRTFTGVQGDGRHPCGRIVEAGDGFLYGTTERGGANDQGSLYRLSKDGSAFLLLASFDSKTGAVPRGGVTLGPNDALYGTTDQGGFNGAGAIFRYGTTLEYIRQLVLANQQVILTCVGEAGANYTIERTTDPATPTPTWSPVLSTNAPASGEFLVTDELPNSPNAFYRMKR